MTTCNYLEFTTTYPIFKGGGLCCFYKVFGDEPVCKLGPIYIGPVKYEVPMLYVLFLFQSDLFVFVLDYV